MFYEVKEVEKLTFPSELAFYQVCFPGTDEEAGTERIWSFAQDHIFNK